MEIESPSVGVGQGVLRLDGVEVLFDEDPRSVDGLRARYSADFRLAIEFSLPIGDLHSLTGGKSISLRTSSCGTASRLIATKVVSTFESGVSNYTTTPTSLPCMVLHLKDADEVEAIVINGPKLHFSKHILDVIWRGYSISYSELPEAPEARGRSTESDGLSKVVTGKISLKKTDDSGVSPTDALKTIFEFARLLTFMRGTGVSIGHVSGSYADQGLVFLCLGFGRSDPISVGSGWYDVEAVKSLKELAPLFLEGIVSSGDGDAITRAIDFYRASNAIRSSSAEVSLVSSYSGVEVLVHHVLRSRGGWSGSLLGSRTPFHEKFRAAMRFAGVQGDILEHSPSTQRKLKYHKPKDAFEMISMFRNAAVHEEQRTAFSGVELFESWQVLQWSIEVLIFYLIGYRGIMNDRRRYGGWRGEGAGLVPLP